MTLPDTAPPHPLAPAAVAALLHHSPALLFLAEGEDLAWRYVTPRFATLTGATAGAVLAAGWRDFCHPLDLQALLAAWQARRPGDGLAPSLPLRLRAAATAPAADGWHRFDCLIEPALGGGWAGSLTDAQGRHDAATRQARLLLELRRRASGGLALIRSMVSRTLEASGDTAHFAAHLSGRLGALSRIQLLLARHGDALASLEEIVREELLAQAVHEAAALEVEGPEVLLPDGAAAALGLALHELAVNAAKFGALSRPRGRVAVTWTRLPALDGQPERLRLRWQESPGSEPPVDAAARHRGFGRELLEQGLPYELDAVTRLDFLVDGLRCEILFPLPQGAAPPPPGEGCA
ncbi:sensor histidine kinase [Roseomonas sp. 18066]|uniref:sensor histidine kinase n=1 Tax=Roseomonas sp. 18066 TaxID=2681412 RepID=UPI00135CD0D7|nr:sensor histidine kinase [Roseomonas sp. 18066]